MSRRRRKGAAPVQPLSIRQQMMADHAELSALFDDVVDAFRCGDHGVAAAMFTRFEKRLATHLALEDETLLPALARTDSREAAALAADHRQIRARLTELGIGVDLHLARASAVSEFVDMLRTHARREDALLYRWADETLSELDRRAVIGRIPRSEGRSPMKVSKLMHKTVVTCRSTDTLERAAQLMWDHDIGCVPIIDLTGRVAGIVTDRDVAMAAYTRGEPLRAIPVTTAMAHTVYSCGPDDEVASVEREMSQHQIRRMPVLDDHGQPIGLVSLNDIARASQGGNSVSASEVASTLAAVCAPRDQVVTAGS